MKKHLVFALLIISSNIFSQEKIFTQFFNLPEQISPSFTSISETSKFGIIDRTQWFGLENAINSQYVFFTTYLGDINSGIGVSMINQLESSTRFSDKKINFNYAYHLNLSEDWNFYPGLYIGYGLRDFSFQKILFEDQIRIYDGLINSTSSELNDFKDYSGYLDFGASFLIFNPQLWAGVSFNHINKPDVSYIYNGISNIGISYSIHSGAKIELNTYNYRKQDYSLYINFNYLNQNQTDRFDLGAVFELNKFAFGGFLAAYSNSVNENKFSKTSANFLFNYMYKKMKIGMSYDFNLSDLMRTKGIFELSFTHTFSNIFRKSNLPCYCK